MACIYSAKFTFKPKVHFTDTKKFIEEILKYLYANYRIINYNFNDGKIYVEYTFSSGEQVKGDKNTFDFLLGDKIEFISLVQKDEILIKRKNYLEYLAECRLNSEDPLSLEEFNKKYYED
jgi:hypothetical protein